MTRRGLHALGCALATAALLATELSARAQTSPPAESTTATPGLRVSASMLARYELRENYADLGLDGRRVGELDGTAYRARLGLLTTPLEIRDGWSAELEFVPQASGFWGDVSAGLSDAELGVHEANLTLVGDALRIEVGRFEMAYGDHLVIGDVGWHETGRSFDGVRTRWQLAAERANVDLFATQVAEGGALGTSPALANGDRYFFGAYAEVGELVAGDRTLELDAYLLGELAVADATPMPATDTALELTIGARVVKRFGRVAVRGEGGVQVGQRPQSDSVLAAQIDGDVMVGVGPTAKLGVGALYASGDDPATARDTSWNQLYPTAHKFLGLMDIMGGRENVAAAVFKARGSLAEPLFLGFDFHLFMRPETAATVDAYTGAEGDLWLGWRVGRGLLLRSQYALFAPSIDGPLATDELAHYIELQLTFVQ